MDSEESVDVAMDDTISNTTTASDAKITDNVDDLLNFDVNKKVSVTPLYENIDIFNQNLVESSDFPLDLPTNALEPPKEKPPPPPTEDGPDELLGNVCLFTFFIYININIGILSAQYLLHVIQLYHVQR